MNNVAGDSQFLVHLELDGEGHGAPLSPEKSGRTLPEGHIEWLHLDATDKASRRWVENVPGLAPEIVDVLNAEETRPRAISLDSGLLVVLRGVNSNPGADPEDMVSVRLWLESGRIISSRRRKLLSMADLHQDLTSGKGPRTSGAFLVSLIEKLADRIGEFVNNIEDRLEENEEQLEELGYSQVRRRTALLRRQMAAVRRFLAPQRDALDRLYRQPGSLLKDTEIRGLREEADRITRYLEDLDLARERAVVLQEEILSQMAQEQNTRMYVLSVVAAIFLPLTFVTGLLGMNVGGLPGIENSAGFWIASAVMLVATAGLVGFFRMKKWI
ncbi:MAG: zinc transporter ZntB [Gammaproteobacteria bacterium]|nr:zinc transporter ZntB [Gammaproteobacteria bacterium]